MTTAYTSLLGLALPVTGELSGTWGDTVNDSITSLLDTSVAGTTNISTDANVTLTTTTGAANQARQAILLFSGARTAIRTVTAPAQSKIYTVINATTGGFAVTLVGAGPTTGVTIANGARTVVAWNGSDFVEVSSPSSIILPGGTANGVLYLNGSKVVTSGSALTFDGTNFSIGGGSTSSRFNVTNGTSGGFEVNPDGTASGPTLLAYNRTGAAYLQMTYAALNHVWQNSGTEGMRLTSTGLGIGTSSPTQKLEVAGSVLLNPTNPALAFNTLAYQVYKQGTSLRLYANSIDHLVCDGSGNVGIGTSSPTQFLTVKKDQAAYTWSRIDNQSSSASAYSGVQLGAFGNTWGLAIGSSAANSNALTFLLDAGGANSEKMRLDSSGNLGLGVTPSAKLDVATASGDCVIRLGNGTSQARFALDSDGPYIYSLTSGDNALRVFTPAGSQAMTLNASGNLGVGTTSPAARLDVSGGSIRVNEDGVGTKILTIRSDYAGLGPAINVTTNDPLLFLTNNTERARIDSSGKFLVNTTSTVASGDEIAGFIGTAGISAKATGGTTRFAGSFWNDATSGDNVFVIFYTEAAGTQRGSITYNRAGGLTAYNTTSDYRAKDISGPVTNSGALIDATPVYMGKMKGATQERPMFIAHETPDYAHTGEKDAVDADGNPVYQQMDASALIPVMWAEIQSLRKRLADAGF